MKKKSFKGSVNNLDSITSGSIWKSKNFRQRKLEKIELDELREAATGASNKNIEAFKAKYDGVLRKAQDLLFERQKIIKSMELKVEAQNIQVSLRKSAYCV